MLLYKFQALPQILFADITKLFFTKYSTKVAKIANCILTDMTKNAAEIVFGGEGKEEQVGEVEYRCPVCSSRIDEFGFAFADIIWE